MELVSHNLGMSSLFNKTICKCAFRWKSQHSSHLTFLGTRMCNLLQHIV